MVRRPHLGVAVVLVLLSLLASCTPQTAAPPPTEQPKLTKSTQDQSQQPKAPAEESKQAKAPDKLRIAYSSISGAQAIPFITKDAGLFEKYNLDVEILFISGSSKLVASLLAGETPIIVTGAQAPVEAAVAGGDAVMIAGTSHNLVFWVYTRPEIKEPQQLKGKKLAITRFGSATHFAARYALQKWGLDPTKDVTLLQLNEMPAMVSALESGAVDAAILSSPSNIQARKHGFRELVDLGSSGLEYQQGGVNTTKSFIQKNEDVVRRFMKAFIEGLHKYRTDKQFSIKSLAAFLKTDDREVLEETYQNYAQKYIVEVPYPSINGIKTIIEEMSEQNPKAKDVKPESVVDLRFMKELDESGFIKQVNGK
ncbi:MAG: ABC transporter substrate-binding protein [Chloroflexi bacterium]|nr:ABC transporter substrate-binding protein [Chloroflexota bacterium]